MATKHQRFTITNLVLSIFLLWCISSCEPFWVMAQQQLEIPAGWSNYDKLLDLLFCRDELAFNGRETEFALVLRYQAGHGVPHTQINISKYRDGRLEVVSYQTTKGIDPYLTTDARELSWTEIEAAAKVIPVERRVVEIPNKTLKKLIADFSTLRFSPLFDSDMSLDGTQYDLWEDTSANQAHFRFFGAQLIGHGPYSNQIVKWMNDVYKQVLEAKTQEMARKRSSLEDTNRKAQRRKQN